MCVCEGSSILSRNFKVTPYYYQQPLINYSIPINIMNAPLPVSCRFCCKDKPAFASVIIVAKFIPFIVCV